MVKVALPTLDEMIARACESYGPEAQDKISRAYRRAEEAHAGQKRASGEPYLTHCLAVAGLLSDLNLDPATIAAGLLHDVVEDSLITVHDLEVEFGQEVAMLVDGVTKLAPYDGISGQVRATLRTANPSRCARCSWPWATTSASCSSSWPTACTTCARSASAGGAAQAHRARDAGNLRPAGQPPGHLADQVGTGRPGAFATSTPNVQGDRRAHRRTASRPRSASSSRSSGSSSERLEDEGIEAEIIGPAQAHLQHLQEDGAQGLPFDQIYDVRAVRVIVDNVAHCYRARHRPQLWRPIPGEFDDYIATPKDNMYQPAHRGAGRRRQAARSADSHPRDARRSPSSASPRTGATKKAASATSSSSKRSPGCAA